MTDIFGSPEKKEIKQKLFSFAVQALEQSGWAVNRVKDNSKSSIRQISKNGTIKKVSIRTSQDTWIAFPRNEQGDGWKTLDEVDAVVAVSVDSKEIPTVANVHLIDGDEMRKRFDRAYEARRKAGYSLPDGRGVWISLYLPESNDPVARVGAGSGLTNPPIATFSLAVPVGGIMGANPENAVDQNARTNPSRSEPPLSIAEAKRRLAETLGVSPSSIKISVEA